MSLRFDTSTDRLAWTTNLPGRTTPGLTICGWAKRVSFAARTNSIAGFANVASGNPVYATEVYWDSSGNLNWTWYNNSGTYDLGAFSTQPGTDWFFFAITNTGTGGADTKYYVGRITDLVLEEISETNSLSFTVNGVWAGDNGWGECGDFLLDNFRLYDRALTASELQLERWTRRPSGVAAPNVWLPMLDNTSTGTQAKDYSGNGRDATTTGLSVQTDCAPISWGSRPALIGAVIVTAQYLAPTSDVAAGAWTPSSGSDLYAMLDEAAYSDADYISATSASTCTLALASGSDPSSSSGHVLRYRLLSGSGTITVTLKQGSTTIASWGPHTLTGAAQDFAQTLTGGQADSITDYSALRVELTSAA